MNFFSFIFALVCFWNDVTHISRRASVLFPYSECFVEREHQRATARACGSSRRKKFYRSLIYICSCAVFFCCTYSASIHICRRFCFFFLSLRLFFPMVSYPSFLFCSFPLVPFPFSLSLVFLHYYQHRQRIKEFVCFPFVFGPNVFFLFFPSFLSVYSRSYSCICRRQMRAHIQKKKDWEWRRRTHTHNEEK